MWLRTPVGRKMHPGCPWPRTRIIGDWRRDRVSPPEAGGWPRCPPRAWERPHRGRCYHVECGSCCVSIFARVSSTILCRASDIPKAMTANGIAANRTQPPRLLKRLPVSALNSRTTNANRCDIPLRKRRMEARYMTLSLKDRVCLIAMRYSLALRRSSSSWFFSSCSAASSSGLSSIVTIT